jgi:nicotinamidase-related amidase
MDSLPLPPFYEAKNAESFQHSPDQGRLFTAAEQWRRQRSITSAGSDQRHVRLLLIDAQRDFCFPEGSLYVGGRSGRGALDDDRRTAEFIYRNLSRLTRITLTLDTHHAFQIFFPSFWVDEDGAALSAHRVISADDVAARRVRPNPAMASWLHGGDLDWIERQALHYCRELERGGRYQLYLWPPHCILGSVGHTLAGVIHEAQLFHSFVRCAPTSMVEKGDNALTENYSVLRPEVLTRYDGPQALAVANGVLLDELLRCDALIVGGQAASHCVKSSVDDLLEAILARDPRLARRVYLLTDCMSSVVVPDGKGGYLADFTPQAEAALARYAEAGMRLVRSTDQLDSWLRFD